MKKNLEAMVEVNENETLMKKQIHKRKGKEEGESSQLVVSRSSRRMRSQFAPDLTVKELMILVNEYAAVESDCSTALSTYQKWNIITENCTAFWNVPRSLNQCRRKWDSMLEEFSKIKQCECDSQRSFWKMEKRERKKLGIPEEFDRELFEAIDNVVSVQQGEAESEPDIDVDDPDSDPDINIDLKVETDLNDVIAELGSKRQKQRSTTLSCDDKEIIQKSCIEEKAKETHKQEKLCKSHVEEEPRDNSHIEEQPSKKNPVEGKETTCFSFEENLRENAERVHQIINRVVVKDGEDSDTLTARCQADQLIACFQDIVNTLNRFNRIDKENDDEEEESA